MDCASPALESTVEPKLQQEVTKRFPNAQLIYVAALEQFILATVHGTGTTDDTAGQQALDALHSNETWGRNLDTMLDDIKEDLKTPGMSRQRHDDFMDSLSMCDAALNKGLLANVINGLLVPKYTREIEELKRKVAARFGMQAQNNAEFQKAKQKAGTKGPRLMTESSTEEMVKMYVKAAQRK